MNKEQSIEEKLNSIAEYVCESLCKIPVNPSYTQDIVEKFCDKCKLNNLVKDFKDAKETFRQEMDDLYLKKCDEVNKLQDMLKGNT